jgi:hypothetical protein
VIYRSILKYGYANFSLEILEYCDKCETIPREQYYLDLLNPMYNILKIAGRMYGYKHSLEAKAKMKSRVLTEEHKAKLRVHLKNLHSIQGFKVSVKDSLRNETIVYPSIAEAAQAIGCDKTTIGKALKYQEEKRVQRLVKKKYAISRACVFFFSFYIYINIYKIKKI